MLGVLFLERDPLRLADVPGGLMRWVQVVGSLAGICLFFWTLLSLSGQRFRTGAGRSASFASQGRLFRVLVIGGLFGYLVLLGLRFPEVLAALARDDSAEDPPMWRLLWGDVALTLASGCILVAVMLPFLFNLPHLSGRRILAIARLSFKEAVRRRILYVFCVLILVLLFLNWFVQSKAENQLKDYVEIVFHTMTPLLLLSAALVSAFSIPTDIRQQTIHTVVTKPVQRFEIVLGRFLGYTALMSLLLLVMTTLSLFYVLRDVKPEAAAESLKARAPVYGTLVFQRVEGENTPNEAIIKTEGVNVGKEWDYFRYISGQDERNLRKSVMYAVWSFPDLPASLTKYDTVRCEFGFDIYRENKGQENRGVLCSLFFQTRNFNATRTPATLQQFQEARELKGATVELTPDIDNDISEEYGYFEVQGKTVENNHTLHVDIPAGLIRNARQAPAEGASSSAPQLLVRVRCDSPGQMLGMARYSLYFRGDGPTDAPDSLGFSWNFYKASLGLWMRMVLIVAVAVAVSTELGGIISFLCVMLLYLGGAARPFIKDIADRATVGGGPVEAGLRLVTRHHLNAPLEETTLSSVAQGSDEVFSWLMRIMLDVFPNVESFSFTDHVATGFSIGVGGEDLFPAFLLLLGYLIPWAILSFYLIRNREIAGAN